MPISFTPRTRTNVINVHIRKNQPDLGITQLDLRHRSDTGRPDSGYHVIVRWNGDAEKGRDSHVIGGWFPDAIEINVICEGDEPTDTQTAMIDALLNHFQSLYPEAKTHYA